jgi:bis(5'-nucleosyl)-tetraphosphatase (symmetrical)
MDLLGEIHFEPGSDHLYLVGDLVGKGPGSLEVMRWAYDRQHCVEMVLGNHDLHLLRCFHGLRKAKESDYLEGVLSAPDASQLIDWLSRRPLLLTANSFQIVHAGVLPVWTAAQAGSLALEAQKALAADPSSILKRASEVTRAHEDGRPEFALRVLTSLRCCNRLGEPAFDYSGPPEKAPKGLYPWYSFPGIVQQDTTFTFGHWAQHGIGGSDHAICLDTSCVYGGVLTALRLPDRHVVQVPNLKDWTRSK